MASTSVEEDIPTQIMLKQPSHKFLEETRGSFSKSQEALVSKLFQDLEEMLEMLDQKSPDIEQERSVDQESSVQLMSERIKELETKANRMEKERDTMRASLHKAYDAIQYIEEQGQAQLEDTIRTHAEYEDLLKAEIEDGEARCRDLFNKLQEVKGNIRVMCRIRPPLANAESDELVDFGKPDRGEKSRHWARLHLQQPRVNALGQTVNDTKLFEFERVFGPEDTNRDVFEEIGELVDGAIEGRKVTIFTYGQTASGKTFTMSHRDEEDRSLDGIIPQTLRKLFGTKDREQMKFEYSIDMSTIEVYMNEVYDLLQPSNDEKASIRMEQATYRALDTLDDAMAVIELASSNRVVSPTTKNVLSSRSHLILTFRIIRKTIDGINRGQTTVGLLSLCDLAGSERAAQTGLKGQKLEEDIKINESLSNLNRVITALGQGTHVPYDTALTKALKPSLALGCQTVMFVMISPFRVDLSVSLQSLEKGQEATKARLASMARVEQKLAAETPTGKTAGSGIPMSSSTNGTLAPKLGIPRPSKLPGSARKPTSAVSGRDSKIGRPIQGGQYSVR